MKGNDVTIPASVGGLNKVATRVFLSVDKLVAERDKFLTDVYGLFPRAGRSPPWQLPHWQKLRVTPAKNIEIMLRTRLAELPTAFYNLAKLANASGLPEARHSWVEDRPLPRLDGQLRNPHHAALNMEVTQVSDATRAVKYTVSEAIAKMEKRPYLQPPVPRGTMLPSPLATLARITLIFLTLECYPTAIVE